MSQHLGSNAQESNCKLEEFTRFAFANSSKEEEIYLLKIPEIANAQKHDPALCDLFKHGGKQNTIQGQYQISIIEETQILTDQHLKKIIKKSLQKNCFRQHLII